jgi:hypothetical protein
MAGDSHFLSQLRALLEGLDDEALATLSSVGLLRRARKDLETLTPTVSESGDSLTVDLGTQKVEIDSRGPSRARCTCSAKTTCQHVLAAWLYLRTAPAPAPVSAALPDLVAELMAFSSRDLIEFAGLPAVRESLAAVESSELPAIDSARQLTLRLVHPPVELRYAGGGLDAFVLDYRGKRREQLIVQAVLAFQKANGASPPTLPVSTRRRRAIVAAAEVVATSASQTAPQQLSTRVLTTLIEAMRLGVLHLSENMAERLLSQSAAAEGAGLHRLALALTRLAHHIDLQLGLNAGTSSGALLDELARTYALAAAIRAAKAVVPDLWGEARSRYEDIARLDLIGVAAEPWRTASGYTGLTLLFWSPARRRWYSATDSRPAGMLGFDPVKRYRAGGPWVGCSSPAEACGASVTLTNARANRLGRLSLSQSTTARLVALPQWPELSGREFSSWARLRESVQGDTSGVGLAEADPHASYVLLRPKAWREATFDSLAQELSRGVVDEGGEELSLCLRYSSLADHAIERLEALRPTPGTKVLGRVERLRLRVIVRPIALLQDAPGRRVDNLYVDEGPKLSAGEVFASKLQELLKGLRRDPSQAATTPGRQSATQTRLAALEDEILRLAERGFSGLSQDAARIEPLEESLRSAGIDLLPVADAQVLDLPERLLRLKYCLTVTKGLQNEASSGTPACASAEWELYE